MASLEKVSTTGEIFPNFDKLLKEVSGELSLLELKQAITLIKSNFEGKFQVSIKKSEISIHVCVYLQIKVSCPKTILLC